MSRDSWNLPDQDSDWTNEKELLGVMAKNIEEASEVKQLDISRLSQDCAQTYAGASEESGSDFAWLTENVEEDSARLARKLGSLGLWPERVPKEAFSVVSVAVVLVIGALIVLLWTDLSRVTEWASQLGPGFVLNTLMACLAALGVSFWLARTKTVSKAPRTVFAIVGVVIGLALLGMFWQRIRVIEDYHNNRAQLQQVAVEPFAEARANPRSDLDLTAEEDESLQFLAKELDLRSGDLAIEREKVAALGYQLASLEERQDAEKRVLEEEKREWEESVATIEEGNEQLARLEERYDEEKRVLEEEKREWEVSVAALEEDNERLRNELVEASLSSGSPEEAGRQEMASIGPESGRNGSGEDPYGTRMANIETEDVAAARMPVPGDIGLDSTGLETAAGGATVSSEGARAASVGDLAAPGPGVVKPHLQSMPRPKYPAMALRLKKEAVVDVDVLVGKTGKVLDASVGKPVGFGFDEAALIAAKQASFRPATNVGVPVEMSVRLRVRFVDSGENN